MIVLIVAGALFVLMGSLAYSGRWRSWTASYVHRPYPMLGALWLGVGLWLVAVAIATNDAGWSVITGIVGALAFVAGLIGIVSAQWLPRLLRPAWFRVWQEGGSSRTEYARAPGRPVRRRG